MEERIGFSASGGTVTAVTMGYEFNLLGANTSLIGKNFKNYSPIDDALVEKEIPKKEFDTGGWFRNIAIGLVATVALAAVAVVTVATFGVGLAAVAAIGATIGAGIVTVSSAVSDKKSGNVRSWQDMLQQTVMGAALGAVAGATVYGIAVAAPIAGQALGLQASMWTGSVTSFTAFTIPNIAQGFGIILAGAQALYMGNQINTMTSGEDLLLEKVFRNNQNLYDNTFMFTEMVSQMYVQMGIDNIGLGKTKNTTKNSQIDETETVTTGNLLDGKGKFKDKDLQARYDEYCQKKNNAGETPKEPLEWKAASDKWGALREQGKIFANEKFSNFAEQYENAQQEITIKTKNGTKVRVDAIATDKEGNIIIEEYKSSETAPFTTNQEKGFPELYESGGKIIGNGKGEFTEGYEIPSGTKVKVVRPNGTSYYIE